MEIIDNLFKSIDRRYAAIDIGSNGVRLLIKSVADGEPIRTNKMLFLRVPLRLGADVFRDRRLSDGKARNLLRLMKAFKQLMKIYDVDEYTACATSAMRDAQGGPELMADIAKQTGIRIRIISGEEEARLIYSNHYEQQENKDEDYLYVDVGGGSTEVSLISGGQLALARSYNIGTIRMLCGAVGEKETQRLVDDMKAIHATAPLHIVGSGGNINKLARLLGKKNKPIDPAELEELLATLERYTPEERQQRYALKADRADVIVPAARIFTTIARLTGAKDIQVPVVGLADGLIDSMARGN